MIIREELNKIDLKTDNDFDLVNLYEATNNQLSFQDQSELKKLVSTTRDPETIATFLQTKMQKQQEDYEASRNVSDDTEEADTELLETKLSRIYQKTSRDGNDFAIIGSEDKDTKKSRLNELENLLFDLHRASKENGEPIVGYELLRGNYVYDLTGEQTHEYSYLVTNIKREDAIEVAQRINQESIIWKDRNFFGILNVWDESPMQEFSYDSLALDSRKTAEFSSQNVKSERDRDTKNKWAFEGINYDRKNHKISYTKRFSFKERYDDDEMKYQDEYLHEITDDASKESYETFLKNLTAFRDYARHIVKDSYVDNALGDIVSYVKNDIRCKQYDEEESEIDLDESYSFNILNETKFSRIVGKTEKGTAPFAIIGTQDKDTKKSRQDEIQRRLSSLMYKHEKNNQPKVGYEMLRGAYTYDSDGTNTREYSYLISNITKDEALGLAQRINQESIIWKDGNFFGIIDVATGKPVTQFQRGALTFNPEVTSEFGSQQIKGNSDTEPKRAWAFESLYYDLKNKNVTADTLFTISESKDKKKKNKFGSFYSMGPADINVSEKAFNNSVNFNNIGTTE